MVSEVEKLKHPEMNMQTHLYKMHECFLYIMWWRLTQINKGD